MESKQPVLSVITVVYNAAADIERTMHSVLEQTYPHIQYLVIDGASKDGTLDIINRYASSISKIVSEPDKGIYDAMNKGLALATGDYVLFMNAGDEIYDSTTVQRVFESASWADVYYGETEMYNMEWQSLGRRRHAAPKALKFSSFRYGMSVSHQAIYIRRELADKYDPKYQLSADIDWILHALKKAKTIINVGGYEAKYMVGGMSKKRHRQSLKERFNIFTRHYGLVPNLFNHLVIAFNLAWYYARHRRTND